MPTKLSVDDLINSVKFDNSFKQSKRMTAYFGLKDYAYSNTHHTKQPIVANPLIKFCFDEIDKLFPEAKVNTVLLNYYPDGDATLPFHSDNYIIHQYVSSVGQTTNLSPFLFYSSLSFVV